MAYSDYDQMLDETSSLSEDYDMISSEDTYTRGGVRKKNKFMRIPRSNLIQGLEVEPKKILTYIGQGTNVTSGKNMILLDIRRIGAGNRNLAVDLKKQQSQRLYIGLDTIIKKSYTPELVAQREWCPIYFSTGLADLHCAGAKILQGGRMTVVTSYTVPEGTKFILEKNNPEFKGKIIEATDTNAYIFCKYDTRFYLVHSSILQPKNVHVIDLSSGSPVIHDYKFSDIETDTFKQMLDKPSDMSLTSSDMAELLKKIQKKYPAPVPIS